MAQSVRHIITPGTNSDHHHLQEAPTTLRQMSRAFAAHAGSKQTQEVTVWSLLAMDLIGRLGTHFTAQLELERGDLHAAADAQQTTDEEPPTGATRKTSLKTMTPGSRDASGGSTCIRHCVYP